MTEDLRSVRVDWGGDLDRWLTRCRTSGARALSATEAAALGYDAGAVVPTKPERATRELLERYAADAATPAELTVEFERLSRADLALVAELGALHGSAAGASASAQPAPGDPSPAPPASPRFALIPGLVVTFGNVDDFPPGALTTTPNRYQAPAFGPLPLAGFHVDNLFPAQADVGGATPRRIGVCLGPGDHWLVLGFADELERRCAPLTTTDVRRHVAAGGKLTCLWLRLRPGDVWVAPVGEVAHVGSALGIPRSSRTAFMFEAGRPRRGHVRRGRSGDPSISERR